MANYATLISAIQSVITENGNNEITGPILQQTLVSIINSLGSGYQFIGIATPSTTPGTPDQRVFYIGSAGTYPNFGPAVVPDGNMGIFYYDSGWHFGTVAFPIGSGTITETNLATALVNKLFSTGYKFAGIATPSTTPGTPNQNVFYIGGPGTYQNFGDAHVVNDGLLGFFKYNNGWTFETVQVGDTNTVKYVSQILTESQKEQARTNIDAAGNEQVSQLENELNDIKGGGEWEEGVILNDYSQNSIIINSSNKWETSNTAKSVIIPITDEVTKVSVEMDGGNGVIAFLKSARMVSGETPDFSSSYQARIQILNGDSAEYDVPADANYLYVATRSSAGVDARPYYDIVFTKYKSGLVYRDDVFKEKIVEMELERGGYNVSGNFNIGSVASNAYLRTPNFLKLPDDGVWGVRTDSSATMVIIRYYKEDYTFLSGLSATALAVSGFTEFTAPDGAAFVKMNFRNDTTTDITPGKAYFKGQWLEENPIYYNVRPADNGYQTLEVRVNLYNPTACDSQTDSVQDNSAVGVDYGVLAIPSQYVNKGTPTRLIIYCHGAAVNYADNANRFDSQDLNPAYWLSEGYAVMDVEGNPFDNENEHFCIPQAYQCYKAAYEWVIAHYNIRRDGVFLGGRSMGGLMTLDIITQERGIPIVAACPNVPCIIPTWYWNYMSAARRTFCANHLGFTNKPTWTGTSPMPSAEWNCLKANFDKLALASPFWRLLNDLPDKDDLFNGTNVNKSSNDPTPFLAVYGNCRMRIKTPIKLFLVRDDAVAIPEMNGDILAKIAKQSGQIFVVREFEDGGHHYDTQNPDLQVTITNTYGVSITTSVVYIEMLAWWREWEQRN